MTSLSPVGATAVWARSGAMALTGREDGPPLAAPTGVTDRLLVIARSIAGLSDKVGRKVELDPIALLAERAAIAGFTRHGARSCGGATRMLRARDDWVAVTLARESDLMSIPAWLGVEIAGEDPWDLVAARVGGMDAGDVVERAVLLGLAVARYREAVGPRAPVGPHKVDSGVRIADLIVVDLSSLWSGPLCSQILQLAGARVVKIEDLRRPDGARSGPDAFFDLLHAGQESVALDLGTAQGVASLRALLMAADIVIEGSRPRALEQLSIDAQAILATGRARAWVSITGHGRGESSRNRVGFGDDAAVAGGLVVWDEDGPCFCSDAIADPAAGLVAAAEALDALAQGGPRLVEISMAGVAADLMTDATPGALASRAADDAVAMPRARTPLGRGPRLGEHTVSVLRELA